MAKKNPRFVAENIVGASRISTMLIPEIDGMEYETMIFGGELDGRSQRYRTYAAATLGHKRWVKRVFRTEARSLIREKKVQFFL